MSPSFGQGEAKKAVPPPQADTAKPGAAKPAVPAKEAPKAAEPAKEAPKATEAPLPPIPKEVQDRSTRLQGRGRGDRRGRGCRAGGDLDPTPANLDILTTALRDDPGRSTVPLPGAVSGQPKSSAPGSPASKMEGVDYVHDVRIVNPAAGLKQWYEQRAAILRNAIAEVRKAKGPAQPAETKPAETKPAEPSPPDQEDGGTKEGRAGQEGRRTEEAVEMLAPGRDPPHPTGSRRILPGPPDRGGPSIPASGKTIRKDGYCRGQFLADHSRIASRPGGSWSRRARR